MNDITVQARFVDSVVSARASFSTAIAIVPATDAYDGETFVTPSASSQILATSGKWVATNITVGSIPSNYGLITWNGSTLTVS